MVERFLTMAAATIFTHLQEGRFERSLALMTGLASAASALEVFGQHYRGSFNQPIMYTPLFCCFLLTLMAFFAAVNPELGQTPLFWISALLVLDGILGFGFHIRGIQRKPGGWKKNTFINIVMGPPLFAPLLLGISGILGIITSFLHAEESLRAVANGTLINIHLWLVAFTGVSALLNGFDAYCSHYKSAFRSKSQWVPIVLSPLLAIAAALAFFTPGEGRGPLLIASCLAVGAGLLGMGFHIRAIIHRPGFRKHLFYNFVYGPPPFAPMLFAASGFFGILASFVGVA